MTLPLGNAPLSQVLTFDDLYAFAQADETLSQRQRDEKLTAIRMLLKIIGRCTGAGPLPAGTVRADVPWLNECLFKLPPKAHGLSKRSFGNVITHLRKLLRSLGLLDPQTVPLSEGGTWGHVLRSLDEANCRFGLSKFAAWCDGKGIVPVAVTSDTLADFEQHIRTRHLRPDVPGFIGNVVKNWRKAAVISSSWPSSQIDAPPRKELYRFNMDDFSPAVQEMVEVFRRRLSGQGCRGPFGGDEPSKNLRPATVEKLVYGLKLALNAHLEVNGCTPAQMVDLTQIIKPAAFKQILMFHWERAVQRRIVAGQLATDTEPTPDAGNTSQTAAVASALMSLARYVFRLPDDALKELSDLVRQVRPERQAQISRRNAAILDRLLAPTNRFALLRLPVKLMKTADSMANEPSKAAVIAMLAVAIEIELNKPLRLTNLVRLRLGEELQFTDPRLKRPTQLRISSQTVKNSVDIEWPISEQLGNLIAHYLRHHRAHLGPVDTAWLFPGCRADGSRHCGTLRAGIKDVIAEHIGVNLHPHIFRAFVAYLVLEANPGALEDVRQLLDHKSLQTCLMYYAYRKREEVAGRVDEVLGRGRTGRFLKPRPNRSGGNRSMKPG